jgi:SAM-dependent methyltransferase
LCNGELFGEPLAVLERAPSGAQVFLHSASDHDDAITLRVFQCSYCALVQLTSAPVPYFRQVITAAGLSPEMRQFRAAQIAEWVDSNALRGRPVLEIGSGAGLMLPILEEAGVLAEGLEDAGTALADLPRVERIHVGYPEQGLRLDRSFAGFVCFNFLEHAPAPLQFLRAIWHQLEPGAVGLVEVPSLEHIVETRRAYDWVADHLCYFTRETLATALSMAGFEVLEVERAWKGYSLVARVRRRQRLDLQPLNSALDQIVSHLRDWALVGHARRQRLAVWGASHQALTLLACAHIEHTLSFVIDSSPAKQNLFTPVTKIPIVAPNTLAATPVDDILVAAAGFSDEVVGLLRGRHHFKGGIAVLRGNELERIQPAK